MTQNLQKNTVMLNTGTDCSILYNSSEYRYASNVTLDVVMLNDVRLNVMSSKMVLRQYVDEPFRLRIISPLHCFLRY
jgi:hypothetical protein